MVVSPCLQTQGQVLCGRVRAPPITALCGQHEEGAHVRQVLAPDILPHLGQSKQRTFVQK